MIVMGKFACSLIFATLRFIEIVCVHKNGHHMRPTIHIHGGYPLIQMNQGTAIGHIGRGSGLTRTLAAAGIGMPGRGTPGIGTPGIGIGTPGIGTPGIGTPSIGAPNFGFGHSSGTAMGIMGAGEQASEMIEALGESMLFTGMGVPGMPGLGATSTHTGISDAGAMNTGQQGQLSDFFKMMAKTTVNRNHKQAGMGNFLMEPTFANGVGRSWEPSHFRGGGQIIETRGGRRKEMFNRNGVVGSVGMSANPLSHVGNNLGSEQIGPYGAETAMSVSSKKTVEINGNIATGTTSYGQIGGRHENSYTDPTTFGDTGTPGNSVSEIGTNGGSGLRGGGTGYTEPGYATVEANGRNAMGTTALGQMGNSFGSGQMLTDRRGLEHGDPSYKGTGKSVSSHGMGGNWAPGQMDQGANAMTTANENTFRPMTTRSLPQMVGKWGNIQNRVNGMTGYGTIGANESEHGAQKQ